MLKEQAEHAGWRFRVTETSAGAFEVLAVNTAGRKISSQCSEPELASTLESVAADALRIAGVVSP
jgi:hypothetical protein